MILLIEKGGKVITMKNLQQSHCHRRTIKDNKDQTLLTEQYRVPLCCLLKYLINTPILIIPSLGPHIHSTQKVELQ